MSGKRPSTTSTSKRCSKKTRSEQDPRRYWNEKNMPQIMKDAAGSNVHVDAGDQENKKKSVMEHIATDLFAELWRRSGKMVAINAVKHTIEIFQDDDFDETRQDESGSWELNQQNMGRLMISDISTTSFLGTHEEELNCSTCTFGKDINLFVYEGELSEWGEHDGRDYQMPFKVKIEVSFDSSNPYRIDADIDITAVNDPFYHKRLHVNYSVLIQ